MKLRAALTLSVLFVLPTAPSSAERAYTWVDENGTTHFSEDPPYDGSMSAEQIELLPAPSAGNIADGDDFYSVINQADRMEKKRLEHERQIAQRLQEQLEARRAAEEARNVAPTPGQQEAQEYTRPYPVYTPSPDTRARPGNGLTANPVKPYDSAAAPVYRAKRTGGEASRQ